MTSGKNTWQFGRVLKIFSQAPYAYIDTILERKCIYLFVCFFFFICHIDAFLSLWLSLSRSLFADAIWVTMNLNDVN